MKLLRELVTVNVPSCSAEILIHLPSGLPSMLAMKSGGALAFSPPRGTHSASASNPQARATI